MKPSLLLIGYRAYGDWLYTVPVLPYLFAEYDVHLETTAKGYHLFHDDPRFASIDCFPMELIPAGKQYDTVMKRWEYVQKKMKADKVINLWRTLETECISERYQDEFHLPVADRQKIFGGRTFYDAVFARCGITPPESPKLDCLYYHDHEIDWAERWREKHQGDFLIFIPVAGTCSHKILPTMRELTYKILDRFPSSFIYLGVDPGLQEYVAGWTHRRIKHVHYDRVPVKQVFLMTKYCDYVLGPETGALVAAGMWGTPKTFLATASSIHQMTKYQVNDFSIQAKTPCSPCHRAVYGYRDCERMVLAGKAEDGVDVYYPECIHTFSHDEILAIIEQVYDQRSIYNRAYCERYIERAKTEIGHRLYEMRWDLIHKYTNGGTLLDYGCASGAFHLLANDRYPAHGFDINPFYGFTRMPEGKIDILTMWDVIEHLRDPIETLREIDAEWVFLCTPSTESVRDLTTWKHFHPGEHLHHFSPLSIARVLDGAGYEVLEINHDEGAVRDPEHPDYIMTVVARRKHGSQ